MSLSLLVAAAASIVACTRAPPAPAPAPVGGPCASSIADALLAPCNGALHGDKPSDLRWTVTRRGTFLLTVDQAPSSSTAPSDASSDAVVVLSPTITVTGPCGADGKCDAPIAMDLGLPHVAAKVQVVVDPGTYQIEIDTAKSTGGLDAPYRLAIRALPSASPASPKRSSP